MVVFTGKELTTEEEGKLRTAAKSIVLKDVQSPERLLDETSLFLHRVIADLPEGKRKMLDRLHGSAEVLRHRKVLVVDDDARNIFALTTILENQEMEVLSATNGRQAIVLIKATPDLSVVLMDIMMPEMDGYETMREIRKDPEFRTLPMLALTAKAMKGDREKCLEAGASDYISKPVNTDQLLSLLACVAVSVTMDSIDILLVDDEPRNLDALEAILNEPSYRLLRAGDADRALHLLLLHDIAAIVLDIKMPGVSRLRARQDHQGQQEVSPDPHRVPHGAHAGRPRRHRGLRRRARWTT